MKFVKTFEFFDTELEAMKCADTFNATHPGWKKHWAYVLPYECKDGTKMFICWSWR